MTNEMLSDWPFRDYVAWYNPLTATLLETAVYHLARRAMAQNAPAQPVVLAELAALAEGAPAKEDA